MKTLRPILLTGFFSFATMAVIASPSAAQEGRRLAPPLAYRGYGPVYATPAVPHAAYGAPHYATHRMVVTRHNHAYRDWATGNENLPLAKPWQHPGR